MLYGRIYLHVWLCVLHLTAQRVLQYLLKNCNFSSSLLLFYLFDRYLFVLMFLVSISFFLIPFNNGKRSEDCKLLV